MTGCPPVGTPLPQPQAHPEATGLPDDPTAAERQRQALADIEARKQHSVTASKDADGNVILALDDGTTAKLPVTPQ